jgi:hypothetical protein
MSETQDSSRVDRLLDAIDHVKANRREEARQLLRDLISEDGDSEEAWLWMSVAVESLDQSVVCLENVLRVNPKNAAAAGALYRLRFSEIEMEKQRSKLRFWRDLAVSSFWLLVLGLIFLFLCSFYSGVVWVLTGQSPLVVPLPIP